MFTLRLFLICLSTAFLTLNAYSQHYYRDCPGETPLHTNEQVDVFAREYYPKPPSGKKQFLNDWICGSIYYTDGKVAHGITLSYNCLLDELLWLRKLDSETGVIPKESIDGFTLQGQGQAHERRFRKVTTPGILTGDVYMEILAEGSYTLYCHRKIYYFTSWKEFREDHKYYISKDGKVERFKLKARELIRLYPAEQKSHIRKVLRNNHLRVNQEDDMVRAITLLNQMKCHSCSPASATPKSSGNRNENPKLIYKSLSGDLLEIEFDTNKKINSKELQFESWPLLGNPWMHQDYKGNTLVLEHSGERMIYCQGALRKSVSSQINPCLLTFNL